MSAAHSTPSFAVPAILDPEGLTRPAAAHPSSGATAPRLVELDLLRGLAILGMALSGMVPRGVLPAWMYHAQLPPPTHAFDPARPGITWVDLVFPFFLFSMGAAMPLALGARLIAGTHPMRVALDVLVRTVVLAAFALYVQHINPWLIEATPTPRTWLLALLGFALLFPALARLPHDWPAAQRAAIRVFGWAGCLALCATLRYADGSGWRLTRSDIIIVVLANTWLFGALIWLLSRDFVGLRLGVIIGLIAFRLSHESPGWIEVAWNWTPVPWIFTPYYLQYLMIVLPGTIIGELLLCRADEPAVKTTAHSRFMAAPTVFMCLLLCGLALLDLARSDQPYARFSLVMNCLSTCFIAVGLGGMKDPFPGRVASWGAMWFVIGLLFEPFEGGIKKDPSNLCYYFVTSGLATFMLLALWIAARSSVFVRCTSWIAQTGANPIVAYVAIRNLIPPLLVLTGIDALAASAFVNPWSRAAWALAKTLLLAAVIAYLTRRRIFFRA